MRRTPMTEKEKAYVICAVIPFLWPLLIGFILEDIASGVCKLWRHYRRK